MKTLSALCLTLMLLLASACGADVCPPDGVRYVASAAELQDLTGQAADAPVITPSQVSIGRKTIEVDRVIHGPLCNDTWSGTVYVACDVQVVTWDKAGDPTFLDGCDLTVDPDAVLYVAAHNNAAYYKGCASCHTTQGISDNP